MTVAATGARTFRRSAARSVTVPSSAVAGPVADRVIRPLTIVECDEQLVATHGRYLRAEARGDLDDACRLYADLDRLLDIRTHLPLPRTSPEIGGASCTDSPSRRSAPPPS